MSSFDSTKYKNQYTKEHYARLSVLVSIEDRPIIDKHWKNKGYKSFNSYVNDLIRKDMNEIDNKEVSINVGDIKQEGDGNSISIG